MKVFFDNCLSPVLADTLNGYLKHENSEAVHISNHSCGRHAKDCDWMQALGEDNCVWIVITGDKRISRNIVEKQAFRRWGLKGFVTPKSYQNIDLNEQAAHLLLCWKRMVNYIGQSTLGTLIEMPTKSGGKFRPL